MLQYVTEIFCDLTKGLDCVNYKLLTQKLHFYGVRGVVILGYLGSFFISWGANSENKAYKENK
jgi:hypothetical protein